MGFDKDKIAFGPKNFKYLDELIHSGAKEIVLDSDIILTDGEESEYFDGIKLDVDDLVIDGNGHTIDAKGKTRIFDCTDKDIIIKNIVLANGYAQKGGAIHNTNGSGCGASAEPHSKVLKELKEAEVAEWINGEARKGRLYRLTDWGDEMAEKLE